jgi:hypothetical protein
MKHFYRELQGWFGARELYRAMVKRSANKATFVEIGAWKGQSAAFMEVEIINSGKDIEFHVIDTWEGSEEHWNPESPSFEPILKEQGTIFPIFKKNLSRVWHKINPIQSTSIKAVERFNDKSVDFVYIDAAHDYENVISDIKAWLPKVKDTGLIAGDDYAWDGVERAVREIFKDRFVVEANNNWIHCRSHNFDYEDFLHNELKRQTAIQKLKSYFKT